MKKLLFSLAIILSGLTVMSQSPRQMVLTEDFTSVLCTYCPGAQMGCDDLLTNGQYVAVVASHSLGMGADPFANTYSTSRNTMYGVSAFPSVCFDAAQGLVGGNHSSSMYTNYLPLYNECIADSSPISMSMVVTNSGLNYTANITLTLTGNISSSNNVLYFFVTESNIQYSWEGQSVLNHVNRLMVPDQYGTVIDFSTGNVQTASLTFTMDNSWVLSNCEFVTALQDKDAGQGNIPGTSPYSLKKYQVYGTIKQGAINLTPGFTGSPTQVPLNGSVTFTNTTFGGYIGTTETCHWILDGATPDTIDGASPTVTYTTPGAHNVTLIVNNGGQIDTLTKTAYIYVGNVGVHNLSQNAVNLFPNPVQDFMTVQANDNIKDISIYNVTGQKVISQTVSSKTVTINTSSLTAGIYYVKTNLDNGTFTKKIVVQ